MTVKPLQCWTYDPKGELATTGKTNNPRTGLGRKGFLDGSTATLPAVLTGSQDFNAEEDDNWIMRQKPKPSERSFRNDDNEVTTPPPPEYDDVTREYENTTIVISTPIQTTTSIEDQDIRSPTYSNLPHPVSSSKNSRPTKSNGDKKKRLPEIDEAGYASLIVNPYTKKSHFYNCQDQEHFYPDLVRNSAVRLSSNRPNPNGGDSAGIVTQPSPSPRRLKLKLEETHEQQSTVLGEKNEGLKVNSGGGGILKNGLSEEEKIMQKFDEYFQRQAEEQISYL